ncbi:MAG: hypothetical protein Q9207_004333 [Kuettlingeria erythrocarpa]
MSTWAMACKQALRNPQQDEPLYWRANYLQSMRSRQQIFPMRGDQGGRRLDRGRAMGPSHPGVYGFFYWKDSQGVRKQQNSTGRPRHRELPPGAQSMEEREFTEEIASVTFKGEKGETVVWEDEGFQNLKEEKLPTLKPAFISDGGTATAANSSTFNDGASALILEAVN